MKYTINLDTVPKNRCGWWTGNKVSINVGLTEILTNRFLVRSNDPGSLGDNFLQ